MRWMRRTETRCQAHPGHHSLRWRQTNSHIFIIYVVHYIALQSHSPSRCLGHPRTCAYARMPRCTRNNNLRSSARRNLYCQCIIRHLFGSPIEVFSPYLDALKMPSLLCSLPCYLRLKFGTLRKFTISLAAVTSFIKVLLLDRVENRPQLSFQWTKSACSTKRI